MAFLSKYELLLFGKITIIQDEDYEGNNLKQINIQKCINSYHKLRKQTL